MAALDLHAEFREGINAPASNAEAVTPSDNDDLSCVTRALWVGGAGDVEVVMASGDTVVFTNVPAGSLLPIRVRRVKSGNTDASDIVALW